MENQDWISQGKVGDKRLVARNETPPGIGSFSLQMVSQSRRPSSREGEDNLHSRVDTLVLHVVGPHAESVKELGLRLALSKTWDSRSHEWCDAEGEGLPRDGRSR